MNFEDVLSDFDLLRSMTLRSALDLDLFQRIQAAQEPPSIAQLVADYKTYDPYILRLLILALSEYMYLAVEDDLVSLTVKGEQVAENIVAFKQLASRYSASGLFSYAALSLHDRLNGRPDYFSSTYGKSYWDLINSDSRLYKSLDQPRDGSESVCNQLDRSQFMQVQEIVQSGVLLELGCGYGDTGYYLFSNMSHKRYILSDLSNMLGLVTAQQRWSNEDAAIAFMPLDFFHDSLPSVDVVLLDSILADWDDNCCIRILRNILRSIRQSGANLVISEVTRFSSSSRVDAIGKLALACAVQGWVREPEDVRSLVLAAGFTACERVAESPMRFTLIARP